MKIKTVALLLAEILLLSEHSVTFGKVSDKALSKAFVLREGGKIERKWRKQKSIVTNELKEAIKGVKDKAVKEILWEEVGRMALGITAMRRARDFVGFVPLVTEWGKRMKSRIRELLSAEEQLESGGGEGGAARTEESIGYTDELIHAVLYKLRGEARNWGREEQVLKEVVSLIRAVRERVQNLRKEQVRILSEMKSDRVTKEEIAKKVKKLIDRATVLSRTVLFTQRATATSEYLPDFSKEKGEELARRVMRSSVLNYLAPFWQALLIQKLLSREEEAKEFLEQLRSFVREIMGLAIDFISLRTEDTNIASRLQLFPGEVSQNLSQLMTKKFRKMVAKEGRVLYELLRSWDGPVSAVAFPSYLLFWHTWAKEGKEKIKPTILFPSWQVKPTLRVVVLGVKAMNRGYDLIDGALKNEVRNPKTVFFDAFVNLSVGGEQWASTAGICSAMRGTKEISLGNLKLVGRGGEFLLVEMRCGGDRKHRKRDRDNSSVSYLLPRVAEDDVSADNLTDYVLELYGDQTQRKEVKRAFELAISGQHFWAAFLEKIGEINAACTSIERAVELWLPDVTREAGGRTNSKPVAPKKGRFRRVARELHKLFRISPKKIGKPGREKEMDEILEEYGSNEEIPHQYDDHWRLIDVK